MLRRKSQETPKIEKEPKSSYIEIPLPKLPKFSLKNYSPNIVNLLLFIILIGAAYFIGVLTTKVQYLEKGVSDTKPAAAAQTGQQAQAPAAIQALAPEEARKIVEENAASLPKLGKDDAKVVVVEFSDFQCPFCKQFFDNTFSQLKTEYIDTGKISYAFRHYPLPFHANAQKASEAAECVNDQNNDLFWEYHDTLFKNQTTWENQAADLALTTFATYATEVGANAATFTDCVTSDKFAQKVKDDAAVGAKAGVDGTPSFFINGKLTVGAQPYATIKAAIDAALKG